MVSPSEYGKMDPLTEWNRKEGTNKPEKTIKKDDI
jgi:hypothetical protein